MHRPDRGVQHTCDDYTRLLAEARFRVSMSRRANPHDNAQAESSFNALQYRQKDVTQCWNFQEAAASMETFIQDACNRGRPYSARGYLRAAEC
jgi:transposase InsO family protein